MTLEMPLVQYLQRQSRTNENASPVLASHAGSANPRYVSLGPLLLAIQKSSLMAAIPVIYSH